MSEPTGTEPVARVMREDDPRAAALLATGWTATHRSWGARLESPDLPLLRAAVDRATDAGYRVAELGPEDDDGLVALEAANRADYPGGPTTAPAESTPASIVADRAAGTRWFGAFDGDRLVAVTSIRIEVDRGETGATSVAAAHRRRGLAAAVKAASVLALAAEGIGRFGTGGADENAASLAMNRRLGYAVTERWLTLAPPS